MSFTEFLEHLQEMQTANAEVEKRILQLKEPINQHLTKVLRYSDYFNNQKHIKDVVTWVRRINSYNPYRPFTVDEFYNMLVPSRQYYYDKILTTKFKNNYSKLPVVRSDDEIIELLGEIIREIQRHLQNKAKRTDGTHSNLNGLDEYLSTFDMTDYE